MLLVEILYGAMLLLLGIVASITDMKQGRIYNRVLLVFAIISIVLGIVYYGYFARDLLELFIMNFVILAVISLILFYTHSFAGGDCKLTIVMGLLYPANYYLVYGKNSLTIFFALGFAVAYGYIYLLGSSLHGLAKGKNKLSKEYVKGYLVSFVRSVISAAVYISAVNFVMVLLEIKGIALNSWIIRAICIVVVWIVGKYTCLKKKYIIVGVLFVDVVFGFVLKTVPFSINPENYILVVILLLCQMTIRTNIYEKVPVDDLEKGMILSSFSSVLMQNSRVRGLPGVSTEDLRCRLNDDEISSIKRWASSRKVETVSVVKKIPFAMFIFLGFISYFILWSVVK